MILIAPDKYKGTLSARRASAVMAEALADKFCIQAPMADGGEGTAAALAHGLGWEQHESYYVHKPSKTAVIDSSTVIGLNAFPKHDILKASSAPLGIKVREIIKYGCDRVIIGIGGTGCCDGGLGFLEGLGIDKYPTYRDKIIGLSDVAVPLLPVDDVSDKDAVDVPSALMFAPQKGAKAFDIPILRNRLAKVQTEYSQGRDSIFDGAGGGLGFAIASAIGAPCYPGAMYVLNNYDIPWDDIELVITGEGKIDAQTFQGKVVDTVAHQAAMRGIPCVAIAGCVELSADQRKMLTYRIIDASKFYSDCPLNEKTAAMRIEAAVKSIFTHPVD